MKRILLLFGGTSSEHQISIKSASSIFDNLDTTKFEVSKCYISLENIWYKFNDCFSQLSKNNWEEEHVDDAIFNIIKYLQSFDLVFPILHGKDGEDGKLQGMLELFHIPFVGCNQVASTIGMDKNLSKIILEHAGIPTLPSISIDTKNYMIEDIIYHMDFPMIVKPQTGGSSIGISTANNVKELQNAIIEAQKYDQYVLIEPFIQAQELECAVLEKNDILTSTVGEIVPTNHFYDYEAKYISIAPQTKIPAEIPENIEKEIQKYAKLAFQTIRGKGFARVDFFYDPEKNKIYLNEINTIPGFTTISMYPKLFSYDGISYKDLLTSLIENELKKEICD